MGERRAIGEPPLATAIPTPTVPGSVYSGVVHTGSSTAALNVEVDVKVAGVVLVEVMVVDGIFGGPGGRDERVGGGGDS